MRQTVIALFALLVAASLAQAGDYPQPSIYPVSWQIDFAHGTPTRIVVDIPGRGPMPFYYMPYTVTNLTGQERVFFPNFVLVSKMGKAYQGDDHIPAGVFSAIKRRENNPALQGVNEIAGLLRQGEDQAKDGVAIWPEPDPRMGAFSIYVGGLSGEFVILQDDKGRPIKDDKGHPLILRKTLQLNYLIQGDEIYPGEDEIHKMPQRWVMR